MFVGIDFGTTNSTLAIADAGGAVELTRYGTGEAASETVRSVLYFDPEARIDGRPAPPVVGMAAINAYLAADTRGRFIQSIKSHMASRSFKSTQIGSRIYTIEQLVTHIVQALRDGAGRALPERVVVGRPVRFVNDDADTDGDAFAEQRLRRAFAVAGFTEVRFELEPVAAAYGYEQRLKKDELVLIADFGGGTTDLCLIDVGPGARARAARGEPRKVRASDGVTLAGDAFDQRIIKHAIAPRLGLGTKYRLFDGDADVPLWIYNSLSRWHLLSFLKSQKTMQLLDEILANAHAQAQIEMLYRVVDEDLGYALHRAVEHTKVELSDATSAVIDFPAAALHMTITRAELEEWIAPDLAAIAAAVERVLERAQVSAKDVDRVFMTGGTSLVPAVRAQFTARFGKDKIRGGEEMTTVGRGLALVARDVFGAAP